MAKTAERIAALQQQILRLQVDAEAEERAASRWAAEYMELIEVIPGCLPDGTGGFSPPGWVRWAKGRLGYKES
jgi:glycerol-3-phosphate responsive antiterminator